MIVREESDGRLVAGFMEPAAVLQVTSNVEVTKVAHEVKDRLQRVKAILMAPPHKQG